MVKDMQSIISRNVLTIMSRSTSECYCHFVSDSTLGPTSSSTFISNASHQLVDSSYHLNSQSRAV